MRTNREALEAVIRHASELEDDYDAIAPTMAELKVSGDTALVPRLVEALKQFLIEQNFYGRDLMAQIMAGIQGVTALPTLLHASARDLGDDQDSLQAEILDVMLLDPTTARTIANRFATAESPVLRGAGLRALNLLEFIVEGSIGELRRGRESTG